MNVGRTVFAQLIAHLSHIEFQKCVARYDGEDHHRSLSCWDQYLAMAFAQFTYRESLRDIEACLRSMSGKLYHVGFRSRIARSTLADANKTHNWRIFADFAQHLIGVARPLHAEDPMGVDLAHSLYALDSTTIDLCLALFPWARFRQHKGAVKMHTLLVFLSILGGINYFGILGMILGPLVFAMGLALFDFYLLDRRDSDERATPDIPRSDAA